jgi:hypothetical protein
VCSTGGGGSSSRSGRSIAGVEMVVVVWGRDGLVAFVPRCGHRGDSRCRDRWR